MPRAYTGEPTDDTALSGIAARTDAASVTLDAFDLDGVENLDATLHVTAIDTGSIEVQLQVSEDGVNWYDEGGPLPATPATVPGTSEQSYDVAKQDQGRWVVTITGETPTITYHLTTVR